MICTCDAPLPDGFYLCTTCGDLLATALSEVADVVTVLDAGLSRSSLTARYGERVSSSGSLHAPLPINETLYDAKRGIHVALMKAALRLARKIPDRSCAGLAAHLTTNLDLVRRQEWAPTLEPELRKHLRHGHERHAKSDDRVFAGTCPDCQTNLYANKADAEVKCAGCGTAYKVLMWRDYAKNAAKYYVGTPADLSRKLSAPQYNHTVTADQIRKWATKRGNAAAKLQRANPELNEHGQMIAAHYRLGDVLKLVDAKLAKHPLEGRTA